MFELESDRLANLALVPEVVENERQVVYSERRLRIEDSNAALLEEQVQATAFLAHPYRIPTIGWPSDIQSWTMADLQHFFRSYYAPNNCTLILVGAVEADQVFALAQKYFAAAPARTLPPPVRTREPEQQGERRLVLQRPGANPLVHYAYHAIAASDPLEPALNLLQTILVGGHASRLNRALVEEKQLAVAIGGGWSEGFDPNVFVIHATLAGRGSTASSSTALDAELDRRSSRAVSARRNCAAPRTWRQRISGAASPPSTARRDCWANTRSCTATTAVLFAAPEATSASRART